MSWSNRINGIIWLFQTLKNFQGLADFKFSWRFQIDGYFLDHKIHNCVQIIWDLFHSTFLIFGVFGISNQESRDYLQSGKSRLPYYFKKLKTRSNACTRWKCCAMLESSWVDAVITWWSAGIVGRKLDLRNQTSLDVDLRTEWETGSAEGRI